MNKQATTRAKYAQIYLPKILIDQSGWSRFLRKLEILRKLKRTNLKQVIIPLSKLLKFIFRKSHCYFFGQRLDGTVPKYAPSVLSAIGYLVYCTFIIILSSIGFLWRNSVDVFDCEIFLCPNLSVRCFFFKW